MASSSHDNSGFKFGTINKLSPIVIKELIGIANRTNNNEGGHALLSGQKYDVNKIQSAYERFTVIRKLSENGANDSSSFLSPASAAAAAAEAGASCTSISSIPTDARCEFVKLYCLDEQESRLPYQKFFYCSVAPYGSLISGMFLGLLGLMLLPLLFTLLGDAADLFFSPVVALLAQTLPGIRPRFAGVTFVAIGNGAADLSSNAAALRSGNVQLAMGALTGAAMFVQCIVAGEVLRQARVDAPLDDEDDVISEIHLNDQYVPPALVTDPTEQGTNNGAGLNINNDSISSDANGYSGNDRDSKYSNQPIGESSEETNHYHTKINVEDIGETNEDHDKTLSQSMMSDDSVEYVNETLVRDSTVQAKSLPYGRSSQRDSIVYLLAVALVLGSMASGKITHWDVTAASVLYGMYITWVYVGDRWHACGRPPPHVIWDATKRRGLGVVQHARRVASFVRQNINSTSSRVIMMSNNNNNVRMAHQSSASGSVGKSNVRSSGNNKFDNASSYYYYYYGEEGEVGKAGSFNSNEDDRNRYFHSNVIKNAPTHSPEMFNSNDINISASNYAATGNYGTDSTKEGLYHPHVKGGKGGRNVYQGKRDNDDDTSISSSALKSILRSFGRFGGGDGWGLERGEDVGRGGKGGIRESGRAQRGELGGKIGGKVGGKLGGKVGEEVGEKMDPIYDFDHPDENTNLIIHSKQHSALPLSKQPVISSHLTSDLKEPFLDVRAITNTNGITNNAFSTTSSTPFDYLTNSSSNYFSSTSSISHSNAMLSHYSQTDVANDSSAPPWVPLDVEAVDIIDRKSGDSGGGGGGGISRCSGDSFPYKHIPPRRPAMHSYGGASSTTNAPMSYGFMQASGGLPATGEFRDGKEEGILSGPVRRFTDNLAALFRSNSNQSSNYDSNISHNMSYNANLSNRDRSYGLSSDQFSSWYASHPPHRPLTHHRNHDSYRHRRRQFRNHPNIDLRTSASVQPPPKPHLVPYRNFQNMVWADLALDDTNADAVISHLELEPKSSLTNQSSILSSSNINYVSNAKDRNINSTAKGMPASYSSSPRSSGLKQQSSSDHQRRKRRASQEKSMASAPTANISKDGINNFSSNISNMGPSDMTATSSSPPHQQRDGSYDLYGDSALYDIRGGWGEEGRFPLPNEAVGRKRGGEKSRRSSFATWLTSLREAGRRPLRGKGGGGGEGEGREGEGDQESEKEENQQEIEEKEENQQEREKETSHPSFSMNNAPSFSIIPPIQHSISSHGNTNRRNSDFDHPDSDAVIDGGLSVRRDEGPSSFPGFVWDPEQHRTISVVTAFSDPQGSSSTGFWNPVMGSNPTRHNNSLPSASLELGSIEGGNDSNSSHDVDQSRRLLNSVGKWDEDGNDASRNRSNNGNDTKRSSMMHSTYVPNSAMRGTSSASFASTVAIAFSSIRLPSFLSSLRPFGSPTVGAVEEAGRGYQAKEGERDRLKEGKSGGRRGGQRGGGDQELGGEEGRKKDGIVLLRSFSGGDCETARYDGEIEGTSRGYRHEMSMMGIGATGRRSGSGSSKSSTWIHMQDAPNGRMKQVSNGVSTMTNGKPEIANNEKSRANLERFSQELNLDPNDQNNLLNNNYDGDNINFHPNIAKTDGKGKEDKEEEGVQTSQINVNLPQRRMSSIPSSPSVSSYSSSPSSQDVDWRDVFINPQDYLRGFWIWIRNEITVGNWDEWMSHSAHSPQRLWRLFSFHLLWPFYLLLRSSIPLIDSEGFSVGWLLCTTAVVPVAVGVYLSWIHNFRDFMVAAAAGLVIASITCWVVDWPALASHVGVELTEKEKDDNEEDEGGEGAGEMDEGENNAFFPPPSSLPLSSTPPLKVSAAGFSLLGFFLGAMWMDSLASEAVGVVSLLSDALGIPSGVAGLTLMAWGNSLGDFFGNPAMARRGQSNMAFTACFAGPLFNLLLSYAVGFAGLLAKTPGAKEGADGLGAAAMYPDNGNYYDISHQSSNNKMTLSKMLNANNYPSAVVSLSPEVVLGGAFLVAYNVILLIVAARNGKKLNTKFHVFTKVW
eukprot:CAMPEP_0175047002 /NCGR_PEP_ID=MMETSP0052_2-20121109/5350_1 /TAXON_ID=51329 ORGANISM="Polytomella parva, Strain SAG 63-3" /NCGR_SAMPLE_ID=MMETSP0052_2 /ASSEMBLY_ACC=CAM_ASM_000194 /LENGTH=2024 /DNA_ID=CAMNT_0016310823 /DNA_START=425 /DNA_END=6497 /DNA_ORIENTATION=+